MFESDDANVIFVLIVFLAFILIMAFVPVKQKTLMEKCLDLAQDHRHVIECQKEISAK